MSLTLALSFYKSPLMLADPALSHARPMRDEQTLRGHALMLGAAA